MHYYRPTIQDLIVSLPPGERAEFFALLILGPEDPPAPERDRDELAARIRAALAR